jgi:hypothetical protein
MIDTSKIRAGDPPVNMGHYFFRCSTFFKTERRCGSEYPYGPGRPPACGLNDGALVLCDSLYERLNSDLEGGH